MRNNVLSCTFEGCKFQSKNQASLRNHFKRQHCNRRYSCDTCDKNFFYLSELHIHEKTHDTSHTNVKTCEECGRKFKSSQGLRYHSLSAHGVKGKHQCRIEGCDKTFDSQEILKEHVYEHMNIKTFACKLCKKLFLRRSNLRQHNRRCKIDKSLVHVCLICKKKFITRRDLFQHNMRHSNTTYDCEKCGKKYKFNTGLSRHKKVCGIVGEN